MNNGYTKRAIVTGIICCLIIGIWLPVCEFLKGSRMGIDFFTGAAIFLFFVLVLGVNVFLKSINRNCCLSSQELLTVYIMMIVACTIPTMGLTFFWLGVTSGITYYVRPENRWQEILYPHIKKWLIPTDPLAVKYFYEGLPQGTGIPWNVWLPPLLLWGAFFIALYFVMICMMAILRKQWVENEKLVFPLVQLSLEMVKEEKGRIIPALFKNRLMWIGFLITFAIGTFNALHHYFPAFPSIKTVAQIQIFRRSIWFYFWLSFPMIGFTYLVPASLSFSLWVFALLYYFERGIISMTGYNINEIADPYTASTGDPLIAHQGIGAIIFLVIACLWVARRHLKDVFLKAIGVKKGVDDSMETLSYPVAFWGMIAGFVFMAIWLNFSGLPWKSIPIFLFALFVFYLGVTRIIAEGGIALVRPPSIASFFVISGFGTSTLGDAGLTSAAFSATYNSDVRTFVMGSAANGLKISEGRERNRILFWLMMSAIVIAIISSVWITLSLCYKYGAINFENWHFTYGAQWSFDFMTRKILNPTGPNYLGWFWTGIGALTMWFLTFMHYGFLWWPLHPLGFIAGQIYMVQYTWMSIFIAWVVKVFILKYGGVKLYKSSIPFFFGLIIGQFTVSGVWLIIDGIIGERGNMLFYF